MDLNFNIGGNISDSSSGGGTKYHYEESVGVDIVVASQDTTVDREDPANYSDLGQPVEFVVDVPAGSSAFVFASAELAFYDQPNAIANGDASDSWARIDNAIIAPPLAPFLRTGNTVVTVVTGPEWAVADRWMRVYGGDNGNASEVDPLLSPEGTVPPQVAPFGQWANLAAGQHTIGLQHIVGVSEHAPDGSVAVEQSPIRAQVRKRKLTLILFRP